MKFKSIILIILIFLLQACSCSCPEIAKPNMDDYTISSSSVLIYGDACAPSDGSTASEGQSYSSALLVPNAQCDDWSGGTYKNRGRWVMVPPSNASTGGYGVGGLGVSAGSTVTLTTYGTVFYCSSGYDNYHISPTMSVYPGTPKSTFFSDGSQLTLNENEIIILNIADPTSNCSYVPNNIFCTNPVGNGVAIGVSGNAALSLPECSEESNADAYSDFTYGLCRGTGGFGLTIYTGENQEATLDNESIEGSDDISYTQATSRTPNLFDPFVPASQQSSFASTISTDYGQDVTPAGPIRYAYKTNYKGVFGLSIAQGIIPKNPSYNKYEVTVLVAPSACTVTNSEATTEGGRGAVMVLFEESSVNPNTVDDVLTTFNDYDPNLQIYYPELMSYLAEYSGVTISNSGTPLNDLLVPSTGENSTGAPNYNPYILTQQTQSLSSSVNGYIWLKVQDDYYHDNLGSYEVQVQVQTPTESLVSEFLSDLIDPINSSLLTATKTIYNDFLLSDENNFKSIAHMSLMIYIIIFGAKFMLGLSRESNHDIVKRVLKIGAINQLFQSSSWDFYNQYFFNLYLQGQSFLITAVTGDDSTNYQGVFGFVDDVFSIFFATYTWEQLAALLPDVMGFIYAMILIGVMLIYLISLAQVFMVYLLAMVGFYVMMALAPMFAVTMLFERTKKIFLGWLKYLFSFAIQPVILFAFLYFVNDIFITFWEDAMSFDICWGEVWQIYFYGVYIWTFDTIQPFVVGCIWYFGVIDSVPIYQMFAEVMMLYFFVLNMQSIISYAPKVSDSIAGTGTTSALVKLGSNMITSASSLVLGNPVEKYKKAEASRQKQEAEQKTNKRIDKWLGRSSSKTDKEDDKKSNSSNKKNSP